MKTLFRFILFIAVLLILITACKKEHQKSNDRPLLAGPGHTCGDSVISGVITSNLYLGDCKIYKLNGTVWVTNNATLKIAPGALIHGVKGPAGTAGGTLVITRGAKINAAGTQNAPIIFTSNQTTPASGDWGGVVILGRADINQGDTALIEGIGGVTPASPYYGGNNNNDNSGILTYIRIEYAGFDLSTDNELNGLTLAGVGLGTIVHHIEVYKAYDDAFEFFGGTVNASYLIAIDPRDDMFDFDNGYTGTIDYALGVSDPTRADMSRSNGIESDNIWTADSTIVPFTRPVINHMTIIGQPNAAAASITHGAPSGIGRYGRAAHFQRSSRFDVRNSLFMGFLTGVSLDGSASGSSGILKVSNTPCAYVNDLSNMDYNLVHAYSNPTLLEGSSLCSALLANKFAEDLATFISINPNSGINLVNPFVRGTTAANYFPTPSGAAQALGVGAFSFGRPDWTAGFSRF